VVVFSIQEAMSFMLMVSSLSGDPRRGSQTIDDKCWEGFCVAGPAESFPQPAPHKPRPFESQIEVSCRAKRGIYVFPALLKEEVEPAIGPSVRSWPSMLMLAEKA